VSERGLPIADGAAACPFVAFEDDRDERATVPDHRHRCYADLRPSPRALAHQEAYCLSSSFPVCPTFQDWARRESARARADAQAREDADAADRAGGPTAGAAAAAAGASAGAAGLAAGRASDGAWGGSAATGHAGDTSAEATDLGVPDVEPNSAIDVDADEAEPTDTRPGDDDGEPRRNPPRDWSAPPPWLASSEAARGGPNAPPPDFLARRAAEPGQGLAGSAADRLAGGPPPSSTSAAWREPEPDVEEIDHRGAPPPPPRRPRAYDQHLGGPSSGPDWERPRRYEAYPTIKTRVGMPEIPRIAVLAALIALAALAFFFLPAILGLGSKSGPSGAPPSGSVAPSVSIEPTTAPAATPILYTIKKNETLSKIATAHGITLQQLLDANPTIKNPNKIVEGQQITIPTPDASAPDQFGPSGSPARSP
jgi:LysM repeat protein